MGEYVQRGRDHRGMSGQCPLCRRADAGVAWLFNSLMGIETARRETPARSSRWSKSFRDAAQQSTRSSVRTQKPVDPL